jgi:hypothetical protein
VSEWRRVQNWGRRDKAEPPIVEAFEEGGATVEQLGTPVDLLVGYLGETHLVECKTDRAKLTPRQQRFKKRWKGRRPVVVRTAPQARKWLAVWAERAQPRVGGGTWQAAEDVDLEAQEATRRIKGEEPD